MEKARQLYHSISDSVAVDYPQLKTALLEKFCLTAKTYRTKLRKTKQCNGEIFKQFVTRLSIYLTRWIDMAGKKKTYKDWVDLLLLEQFMSSVPQETVTFIRERVPKTAEEAGELVQIYREAHPKRQPQREHDSPKVENPPRGQSNANR